MHARKIWITLIAAPVVLVAVATGSWMTVAVGGAVTAALLAVAALTRDPLHMR